MSEIKILSKPVKQPTGYWHMQVEIDGKEEIIKDLSPAACRERLKFMQTGLSVVDGTVDEEKEYPLLGKIFKRASEHYGNYSIHSDRLMELLSEYSECEEDVFIVTVSKTEMFGEIRRICRELDIELKSPNRTLCKSLIAYTSASSGTPLRRAAGCSRSWVFSRDIYRLVYCYEGELLERRDEEARTGSSGNGKNT